MWSPFEVDCFIWVQWCGMIWICSANVGVNDCDSGELLDENTWIYFQPIEDDFEDDADDVGEDDLWSDFICSE